MGNNVLFENFKNIHFIGVGGISMSGLAKFCLIKGFKVSGSDKTVTNEIKKLAALGGKIYKGHAAKNISGAELVVYSSAIDESNPELVYARGHNIPVLKRSELLGQILSLYRCTVAVSGSHGKTTATAMLAEILIAAGLNPTVFLGGERKTFGNFRLGGNGFAVAEACEYKRNFLDIKPDVAVVLNVDNDHVDTFKNMRQATDAFSAFVGRALCVVNADDEYARNTFNASTVTFGVERLACYKAKYISKTCEKAFTVYAYGRRLGRIRLKIAGGHNVYNALAAIAVASELKVPFNIIKTALESFDGVKRRNEYLGEFSGVKCFADYAHHPTEIRAALKFGGGKTLVVFQPHTYSRTAVLMNEFVSALGSADGLIIYKTYPAREKYVKEGDAFTLYEKMKEIYRGEIRYVKDGRALTAALNKLSSQYEKILFLGAGDIYELAKTTVKRPDFRF